MASNPLISDRDVDFLLDEILDLRALLALPAFADHTRETCGLYLGAARKLARERMYPAYRPMDEEPCHLEQGRVRAHPRMHPLYRELVELGVLNATRGAEVGGVQLPIVIATAANAYLMAGNLAAYAYLGLTTGAGRLIESFGSEALKQRFMRKMYAGEWTGTMALTEPGAGSSLADVRTKACPTDQGYYLIQGSKVFISGGDHDLTENIVHLTLARIEGAPPGIKGVSLFAIPRLREEGGRLVPNDAVTAGVFKKIGWRGLPSIALNFGEANDCRGWLVGEPHTGIRSMFQMMNEARLMVGANAVATASVAYQEALEYAKNRPQGRPAGSRDPATAQVAIIEHADVRRMLLRQKAIVEGGLALVLATARYADLAEHAPAAEERAGAQLLLDLLTPVAKTFPAEKGFEANALAVQVHGGYGYTSEYMPEAWLRDQKLNTIHEGTSGIQSMDLLGRKVMAQGGAALKAFAAEVAAAVEEAGRSGLEARWGEELGRALRRVLELSAQLGGRGAAGDVEGMLLHSFDYLELFSVLVVSWLQLRMASAAQRGLARGEDPYLRGKLQSAQYWLSTELPRIAVLAELCASGERSYADMRAEWF